MRSLAPLRIGYFADGIWAHNAFRKLIADSNFHICFITPRFDSTDSTLLEFATRHNIPYIKARDINAPSFLENIAHFKCDIFVSMSFNQIFKEPLLSFPRLKTINCHAGKLPAYRGRNILNWALINDEREFGISVHYVDSGIDTGDIILQRSYPITDEDDYTSLLTRAHTECAQILYDALGLLHRGEARPYPQAKEGGFYCPARVKGDEWIDWHSSSRDIFNFIRALNAPDLGARALLGGEEIIIYKAEMIEGAVAYRATPGAIVGVESLEGSDLLEGHSASLSNSAFERFCGSLPRSHCGARLSAPHSHETSQPTNSSQNPRIAGDSIVLESCIISESTASESHSTSVSHSFSESSSSVIDLETAASPCFASERKLAKQSTESKPHASLESKADSETPSGGVYLHRDKNEIARSANLEASSGRGDCQGGRERLRNSSPSPLDEKEKEILKNSEILEVKTADSKAIVSESENQVKSAIVGDSEKQDSDSKNLESAIASHPQIPAQARSAHRVAIVKTLDSTLRLTHYKASRSLKIGDRLFSLATRGGGQH